MGPDFPKTGIFIGNSFFYYNNGLPGHLSLMEKAADPDNKQAYRNTMVTIGGSGFDWHDVESYFRPNAIGNYSFDENNNVVFNKLDRLFDVAVMMDCSQCPIHPKLKSVFTDYAKKNSDIVRAKGAKPVFFMSWAYADKPEMTAQLAEAYTSRRQRQQRAGDSRGPRVRQARSASSPNSISMRRTSAIRRSPAPIWRPAWCLRR